WQASKPFADASDEYSAMQHEFRSRQASWPTPWRSAPDRDAKSAQLARHLGVTIASTVMLCLTLVWSGAVCGAESTRPSDGARSPLPLPSSLPVRDYEKLLFDFLNRREYKALGWSVDKRVRDTGPYINGKYYGTHPAVRIY